MTDTRADPTGSRVSRTRRSSRSTSPAIPSGTGGSAMSALETAAELLLRARTVVLVAHIHPDADALGSALALGLGLQRRGATVAVSFGEPDEVPESLRELPGQHLLVPADQVPERPELVVSVDAASVERMGSLARLLDTAQNSLVIDHHASNDGFGRCDLVDVQAEATVVIVTRLLDLLDMPIDRDIAANLYAGLATDTRHFRTAGAQAHRLAARLIEAGVRPAELLEPITDVHSFAWMDVVSAVLGRAVLDRTAAHGHGLIYTVIDSTTWSAVPYEELDPVIDVLRTAREAAVAAVLKQTGEGLWQVSMRSRAPFDIAQVAAAMGGGGHANSAGFTHRGDPEAAVRELAQRLAEYPVPPSGSRDPLQRSTGSAGPRTEGARTDTGSR